MRFEAVQRLLRLLSGRPAEDVLEDDPSFTESERALGRVVLPLIREREAMEKLVGELSGKAEALQVAIDQIPIPALVAGPQGALLTLNRAAEELFSQRAIPGTVQVEVRALLASAGRGERAVDYAPGGGRPPVALRVIAGSGAGAGATGPEIVYVVQAGISFPLDREKLARTYGLTPKEAEVAALAVEGLTNKEIAARLHVSIETTRTHLYAALGKTGAKNRAALVSTVFAAQFGISLDLP